MKEGTSSVPVQSGPQESWWAEAKECCCSLRNVQDILADGHTPYELRFNSPPEGPIILFGAEVKFFSKSAKDQGRVHQPGTKFLFGIFMEYALNAAGSWTGEIFFPENDATI